MDKTDRYASLNKIIKSFTGFLPNFGKALALMKNNRFYAGKYRTWPEYCERELRINVILADYLIAAAQAFGNPARVRKTEVKAVELTDEDRALLGMVEKSINSFQDDN